MSACGITWATCSTAPYDPGVLIVEPVEDPGEVEPSPMRRYVRSVKFASYYEAMSQLGRSSRILVQVYAMERAKRQLHCFVPEPVPVLLQRGYESPVVWWPRLRAAGSSRGAGSGDGGDDGAPILADALSLEDEADGVPDDGPAADKEELLASEEALAELLEGEGDPEPEPLSTSTTTPIPSAASEPAPEAHAAVAPAAPEPMPKPRKMPRVAAARPGEVAIAVPGGLITWFASNVKCQAACMPHFWRSGTHWQKREGPQLGRAAANLRAVGRWAS